MRKLCIRWFWWELRLKTRLEFIASFKLKHLNSSYSTKFCVEAPNASQSVRGNENSWSTLLKSLHRSIPPTQTDSFENILLTSNGASSSHQRASSLLYPVIFHILKKLQLTINYEIMARNYDSDGRWTMGYLKRRSERVERTNTFNWRNRIGRARKITDYGNHFVNSYVFKNIKYRSPLQTLTKTTSTAITSWTRREKSIVAAFIKWHSNKRYFQWKLHIHYC